METVTEPETIAFFLVHGRCEVFGKRAREKHRLLECVEEAPTDRIYVLPHS